MTRNLKKISVMTTLTSVLVAVFSPLLPHPLNPLTMSTPLNLLNQIPRLDHCHLSPVASALTPLMTKPTLTTSSRFVLAKLQKPKKKVVDPRPEISTRLKRSSF